MNDFLSHLSGIPPKGLPKALLGLTDKFTVFTYHQRGCGKSSRPITSFEKQGGRYYTENAGRLMGILGVEAQLLDIDRIRLHLGVEKLILVGHSFGGFLATMYACEYPDRVEALILVAPANVLVTGEGLFGEVVKRLPTPKKREEFEEFTKTKFLDFSPRLFGNTEDGMRDLNNKMANWIREAFKWGKSVDFDPSMTGGFMTHALYMGIGMLEPLSN